MILSLSQLLLASYWKNEELLSRADQWVEGNSLLGCYPPVLQKLLTRTTPETREISTLEAAPLLQLWSIQPPRALIPVIGCSPGATCQTKGDSTVMTETRLSQSPPPSLVNHAGGVSCLRSFLSNVMHLCWFGTWNFNSPKFGIS